MRSDAETAQQKRKWTQKNANASSQKGKKRAQKSAKGCKGTFLCRNCKQPGLKQPGLGTPNKREKFDSRESFRANLFAEKSDFSLGQGLNREIWHCRSTIGKGSETISMSSGFRRTERTAIQIGGVPFVQIHRGNQFKILFSVSQFARI